MNRSTKAKKLACCRWVENDDGYYETDCDKAFVINDGSPLQNDMRFCCYCGRVLVEKLVKP